MRMAERKAKLEGATIEKIIQGGLTQALYGDGTSGWKVTERHEADELTLGGERPCQSAREAELSKIAQSLEAELARRDKQLIEEFFERWARAPRTESESRFLMVPDSTAEAIMRTLKKK